MESAAVQSIAYNTLSNPTDASNDTIIQSVDRVTKLQEDLCFCRKNKISTKNVWKLNTIDIMQDITSRDEPITFSMAAEALDVGSKVYSYRVDDLYISALRLSSTLLRLSIFKEPPENVIKSTLLQQRKRKRRCGKNTVRLNSNDFCVPQKKIPPAIFVQEGGSDSLLACKLLTDPSSHQLALLRQEKYWSKKPDRILSDTNTIIALNTPEPSSVEDLVLCSPLKNFELSGESPEKGKQELLTTVCLNGNYGFGVDVTENETHQGNFVNKSNKKRKVCKSNNLGKLPLNRGRKRELSLPKKSPKKLKIAEPEVLLIKDAPVDKFHFENSEVILKANQLEDAFLVVHDATPQKVTSSQITDVMPARTLDIEELKNAIWQLLRSHFEIGNSVNFSQVYAELPTFLGDKMRTILNCPLAVFALLHLSSYHNLQLIGHKDCRDFTIRQIVRD